MTTVVAGIIWEIVGYGTLSAATVNAIAAGVVFVGSVALSYGVSQALAEEPDQNGNFKSSSEALTLSRKGAAENWQLIYGRSAKGGNVIFEHTTATLDRIEYDEQHVITNTGGAWSAQLIHGSGFLEALYVEINGEVLGPGSGGTGVYSVSTDGLVTVDEYYDGQPVRVRYVATSGPRGGKFLHRIYVIASHECEAIDEIYAGDELVPIDGTGNATGTYGGYLYVEKHLGVPGEAASAALIAAAPDKWTAAHDVAGHCYLYVRFWRGNNIFPWVHGIPNIWAVVKGKNDIYDPRTADYGWTDNPVLCLSDYIASPLGLGAAVATQQDVDVLIAEANICDEAITLAAGGTEPRYTCNGVVDTGMAPRDVINRMRSSMAGDVIRVGGKWKIYAGAYRPHTLTLTQSDFVGTIKTSTLLGRRAAFNGVKGVYASADTQWQPADFPAVKSDTFMTEDGGERIWKDVELPFTTSGTMAQRLAKIELLSGRQQISHVLQCKFHAWRREPPDTIGITLSPLGYSDKPFKINEMGLSISEKEVAIDLVLRETDASIYDWSTSEEQSVDPAPNTTLPNPFAVLAPGTPAVQEVLFESFSFGVQSKAVVTWGESPDGQAMRYNLQWRKMENAQWFEHSNLSVLADEVTGLEEGAYVFRVNAQSRIGVLSPWAQTIKTLSGLTAAPGDVAGFSVAKSGGLGFAQWTETVDLDVRIGGAIVIRHAPGTGTAWEDGIVVGTFSGQSVNGVVPLLTGTYMAKWRDSSEKYSNAIASFYVTEGMVSGFTTVATSTQHTGFTGSKTNITLDGGLGGIRITTPPGTGVYLFDAHMDLTTTATRRFEADIVALAYDTGSLFDSHAGLFDSATGLFDGGNISDCNAVLYARTTDDNPAGSPTWGAWTPFVVADFTCRALQFKLELTSGSNVHNIVVTELSVQAKEPN